MVTVLCGGLSNYFVLAQTNEEENSNKNVVFSSDTLLTPVVITAYRKSQRFSNQSSKASNVSKKTLSRFNTSTLVSAVNTVPGVRMEQRSPGSYRINIRGSSLRSPFGVRNVKMYYNGIPFTDPGGNTYLNQLSMADINAIEIIKGPSGSMYGAGLGGAFIIKSPLLAADFDNRKGLEAELGVGSYGLMENNLNFRWGENGNRNTLRYTNLESDGYRDHTAMHHQTLSYETLIHSGEKRTLSAFFRYTNLDYQTPGALTAEQFEENPRASRPAAGNVPSAKESNASVQQKAFLAGVNQVYRFSSKFANTLSLYGSYTDFTNPTFLNYEYRKEPHFGGRTVFEYRHLKERTQSKFLVGGELQQGFFSQQDFINDYGKPGSVMTFDRVNELTAMAFAQAEITYQETWEIIVGFSFNFRHLHFERNVPENEANFSLNNHPVFTPKLQVSKKVGSNWWFFADISRGFSPPTVAEILPSTTERNPDLEAEKGFQVEIGSKGSLLDEKLFFDVNLFWAKLNQSITSRKDIGGADYFINSGGGEQKGLEAALQYDVYQNEYSFINRIRSWGNLAVFGFKYKDFQSGEEDFSGKRFPGTANTTLTAGTDIESRIGLGASLTYQHTSKIPLNDANTVYADAYDLLGVKVSYRQKLSEKINLKISLGGDNLLDQTYSLGNDLNAFGNRYYNVAPGINFYGSLRLQYTM